MKQEDWERTEMKQEDWDRALFLIADLVEQGCFLRKGAYETGFIRIYKTAMQFLVEQGVMIEIHDGYGRAYEAKFCVDNDAALSVRKALDSKCSD